MGLSGGHSKRPDLNKTLDRKMQDKRVWDKRQDIELDSIFDFLMGKSRDKLDDAENNNLYSPERFVDRPSLSKIFDDFLSDRGSQAVFISGASGCGKTAAVMHLVGNIVEAKNAVMLLRAVELPDIIIKPKRLERWLTAELGYKGTFSEVLERANSLGNRRFLLVVDGLNEYTAAGRDASLLFRAINNFIADHQGHQALKVIMTARADGLNAFLPKGRFPPDVDDEVFYRPQGRDFIEIGLLSKVEALKIMNVLQISEDKATNFIDAGGDTIRNPQIIHEIASGAIDARNLKNLDSAAITGRFLERRLGHDRELRRSVTDLVKVIGRTRNMVVSEKELAKKAPKLLNRLQANNNRIFSTLRELEIIQQLETEDDSGQLTWSITLTHDTIFDALSKRQNRKLLFLRVLNIVVITGVLVGAFWGVINGFSMKFEKQFNQRIADGLWTELNESKAQQPLIEKSYKNMVKPLQSTIKGPLEVIKSFFWRALLMLSIPVLVTMLIYDIWDHILEVSDQREIRLLYFGREHELRLFRRMSLYASPGLLLIIWTIVRFNSIQYNSSVLNFLKTIWPLSALFGILFLFFLPWVNVRSVQAAKKGSMLLKEYLFSRESRKRTLYSFVRSSSMIILILAYIYIMLPTAGTQVFPNKLYEKIQIDTIESINDIKVTFINSGTIDKEFGEAFALRIQDKLLTFLDTIKQTCSRPLLDKDTPEGLIVLNWIPAFGFIIIIALGFCQVFIKEIAARKYYTAL